MQAALAEQLENRPEDLERAATAQKTSWEANKRYFDNLRHLTIGARNVPGGLALLRDTNFEVGFRLDLVVEGSNVAEGVKNGEFLTFTYSFFCSP